MLNYLLVGTVLGVSAGFSPGPLLALVISETLRHDVAAGIKVAIAPIVTDLPIILVSVFILAKLSDHRMIFGLISFFGGMLLVYMGYECFWVKSVDLRLDTRKPNSLRRGIMVNVLSPYPYLFWISVGAPTTIKALNESPAAAMSFNIGFYALLVGSKVVLAILVGKSRSFLKGKLYLGIMRGLGLVLIVFALFLIRDGMKSFGVF
ncbi:MAG: LysE family transporter [Desulfobacterales bacterium]|jgi:threonine/homoserine/homoserine lactone efflux protein|nr:LysE family transporter [Desulfobacterales bacterium]